MCGIGLIVSGEGIEGYSMSSTATESSSQAAAKVVETSLPNIQDLCGPLHRRGPDHVGGVTLHIWPFKQHTETWASHLAPPAIDEIRVPLEIRLEKIEGISGGLERKVSSSANETAEKPFLSESRSCATMNFIGATLQLRGDHPVVQPLKDSAGNVLVYNGEVFGGLVVKGHENDSEILLEALGSCCECECHSRRCVPECQCQEIERHEAIPQVLSRLRGPWALIYWQAMSQTLWFGRDFLGRRSLLVHAPSAEDSRLLLTSVAPEVSTTSGRINYWEELPCGIYSFGYFRDGFMKSSLHDAFSVEEVANPNLRHNFLKDSVKLHPWEDPRLRSLLAWERRHVNPRNTRSPSETQCNCCDLQQLCARTVQSLAPANGLRRQKFPPDRNECPQHENTAPQPGNDRTEDGQETSVHRVLVALQHAVKKRTSNIQTEWRKFDDSISSKSSQGWKENTPVAVLFSGGLDSMILAALADQFVDPECSIDLLNVSFDGEFAPDRITAITGIAELQEVFPSRRWRLIEISAKLSDLTEHRRHLESLICPSDTYMDLNIGSALWLAASGEGYVRELGLPEIATIRNDSNSGSKRCGQEAEQSQFPETGYVHSEARVLLVGSGADEQCGGYGRHRTKFRSGGWESLEKEMRLDFTRIWKRNLGRDDRCIADQGKEARFPFLDEDVIATLLSLSLWEVVDFQQPAGMGDKMILRQVAKFLGLKSAAALPKRAIQFGSRIARESNRKDFGSNRAANQASSGSAKLKKTPI